MATEFKLPELGENITQGDLVRLLIKEGDTVAENQPVLELETDKASIEVPSTVSGRILKVLVKEGQKIKVDQVIFTVEGNGAGAQPKQKEEAKPDSTEAAETKAASRMEPESVTPPAAPAQVAPQPAKPAEVVPFRPRDEEARREPIPAAPSVRQLAREIGIDIYDVPGTGPGGRITADDVRAHAKRIITGARAGVAGGAALPVAALPDFTRFGEVERQPMRAVRRKTAEHLSQAWLTIPHVTQHDKADITELEQVRQKYGKSAESRGGKLTMTAIALKVCAAAIKQFPQFASSVDMPREELILKKYSHIGVAVDTDRGLLVPVIRDCEHKTIIELSVELAQVAEKARNKKLTQEEMEGGVFTITNLGGIGGTAFTPIVNWPEVAILGMSRGSYEPRWRNECFEPRLMLPLSLSYDHRVIDGADAARFLRFVCEAFEEPLLISL